MRGCDRNVKIYIGSAYFYFYSEMQNKSQTGDINFAQQKLRQSVMGCVICRNKYSPVNCTRKMKGRQCRVHEIGCGKCWGFWDWNWSGRKSTEHYVKNALEKTIYHEKCIRGLVTDSCFVYLVTEGKFIKSSNNVKGIWLRTKGSATSISTSTTFFYVAESWGTEACTQYLGSVL